VHVDTEAELRSLRTALRDLVALSAIPAAWTGTQPPAVAAGLADALVALLQLDFAFVRLSYPHRAGVVDVTRGSAPRRFLEWLERHAATRIPFPGKATIADVGDAREPCRAVAFQIGVNGDGGLVAAASARSDFPTTVEQVLLSLAANQAATAFQNACLIDERTRAEEELRAARDELEVKVAERTAELHVANDELSALRRVATLVADGVQPQDLFAVVAEEVARVVDVPLVMVARYEVDDSATECASFPEEGSLFPVGKRWSLEGTNVLRLVRESSESARLDDCSELEGEIADVVRRSGIRSTVGIPVVVAGRVWGAMVASTTEHDPLPQGTEARLADFTELLATAIENAESREALAQLVDEQAALRRMAELVAQGVPPTEIFSAVSHEVGRLFGSDTAAVVRFDHDEPAIVFVGVSKTIEETLPIETRCDVDDSLASGEVYRTGRSGRVDAKNWSSLSGPVAAAGRRLGVVSTVASPIVVQGRPWGALSVSSSDEPLPLGTEERLERFSELVATAIANAESREALGRLADEQATLQRMATLVAKGAPPVAIFSAVSEEVGRLLGSDTAAVARFEHDPPAIVVVGVGHSIPGIPVGTRSELDDALASAEVYRTGRSARIDARDWASASGPIHEPALREGLISTVASPIVVEGRLWGTMSVSAKEPLPLDTEKRLERFTELVATAISNAGSRSELAASRRRIVGASDEARRRIERDLHDGTQQRLVSLGLAVRAAEAQIQPDSSHLRSELSRIATGLTDAVAELQELSRGIHPAILSQGGLGPALRTLARRSAIPVELNIATEARLPEPTEVAAYYVASEGLANAAKYAQASRVEVSLTLLNGSLLLSIRDDGVGGADPARGSGLVGLTDRVEALGGSISVQSRPGAGTQITAELPLELEGGSNPQPPSAPE
jgi:signal transduction histidine kinase